MSQKNLNNSTVHTGVKVSQNAQGQKFKLGAFRLQNYDFTARTHVPGPSKLATFAIVIQL